MTAAIVGPMIQGIIAIVGTVFTVLIGIYVPRAITAFDNRTGVVITDQERAAVMSAVTTGAGLLQTQLDQGLIKISDVTPEGPAVTEQAAAAIDRVPRAAGNQGVTPAAAAAMIVARVNTTQPPPIIVVPTAPAGTMVPRAR